MAYFSTLPSGKVRAQVVIRGVRRSKSFPTETVARAWAAQQEESIRSRSLRSSKALEASLLSSIPPRVLRAIQDAPFKMSDILESPVQVPMSSGVYFLICDSEVMYVGRSADVFYRLSQHRQAGLKFDAFNVVYAPKERLDELERIYIDALLPKWNQYLGGPERGTSIKSRKARPSELAAKQSTNIVRAAAAMGGGDE